MASFFSSLIPTSLHLPSSLLGRSEETVQPSQEDNPGDEQANDTGAQPAAAEPAVAVEEPVVKKRERKPPSETFIIVRPPPSKSNHPLNLQIQLVPPHTPRDRAALRQSVDFSSREEVLPPPVDNDAAAAAPDSTLGRRGSMRSDRSASLYSSIASSSVTSLASTASGRRIVPLYNLSAHNVMQNTVVDAGTDAKVAKFLKKAVEMVNVALLEPVEVWDASPDSILERWHTRASDTSHHSLNEPADESNMRTPTLNDFHSSADSSPPLHPEPLGPQKAEPGRSGGKKLFGKMFKKRTQSISETPVPATQPAISIAGTPASSMPSSNTDLRLQPPTLGTQPCLASSSYPPHGRPSSYVWIVRKWMKPTGEGWLNKGLGNLRIGSSQTDPTANIQIRFEWVRARESGRSRARRRSFDVREGSEATPENRRHSISSPVDRPTLALPVPSGRASPSPSRNSRSPSPGTLLAPPSIETSSTNSDSDPEDSDTPWTCTIHILPRDVKFRVAALVPAPHHPKLLGQVKLPFPLPDVALDRGELIPRLDGVENKEPGLLMTAEDIKDIVASTCLWLVVRESFGGINKKRKGDGWRIRS